MIYFDSISSISIIYFLMFVNNIETHVNTFIRLTPDTKFSLSSAICVTLAIDICGIFGDVYG